MDYDNRYASHQAPDPVSSKRAQAPQRSGDIRYVHVCDPAPTYQATSETIKARVYH